jgi:hypothetical protein
LQEIGHSWKRNRLSNLNLNETNLKKPHSPVSNNGGEQGLPNQRYLPGHSSAGRTVTAAAVCVRCGARFHEHNTSNVTSWPRPRLPACWHVRWDGRGCIPASPIPGQVACGPPGPGFHCRSESESAAGPPGHPAIPCQCQSDCQRDRDADSTAGRFRLWAPLALLLFYFFCFYFST